jgi:YggT family protein
MRLVMNFLSSALGLYSVLIIIRIILTWFPGTQYSRPVQILSRVTDPYLDWWRRYLPLRVGILDMSPLLAMIALSVAQTICSSIARYGRISLGVILAVCLSALWSAASFILGFCVIVLILRLVALLSNANIFSPFWQIIDSISRPLLYRIGRIFFGRRIVGYKTSIIVSIVALSLLWVVGRFAVTLLTGLFFRSPV